MNTDDKVVGSVSAPKAQPIAGILIVCLDVLLAVGLMTFASPCIHLDGAGEPSCLWASRAMLGVSAVVFILAVVRVFETDEGERRGLSLACALSGLLVAAMPGLVISLCADPAMACNAVMRPFALAVGVCIALVGGIDLTRRLLALRPAPENGNR